MIFMLAAYIGTIMGAKLVFTEQTSRNIEQGNCLFHR